MRVRSANASESIAAQVLGERVAVREHAVAAVRRSEQRVQGLKSRHGIAIGIIGVQPESEIGIGKIFRLRHGADIEHQAVVGLDHPPGKLHRIQDGLLVGGHGAHECDPLLQQAGEPSQALLAMGACVGEARPGEIAHRIEGGALEPAARHTLRSPLTSLTGKRCQPVDVECCGPRLAFPFDAHGPVLRRSRSNARLFRQIRDVHESLTAVRVPVFAHIVAQPEARERVHLSVGPLDREDFGGGMNPLHPAARQGKCPCVAAARAVSTYSNAAPSAAAALTPASATNTPCHPNATETRATLSPARTAPR